jgi:hypothetical protein
MGHPDAEMRLRRAAEIFATLHASPTLQEAEGLLLGLGVPEASPSDG